MTKQLGKAKREQFANGEIDSPSDCKYAEGEGRSQRPRPSTITLRQELSESRHSHTIRMSFAISDENGERMYPENVRNQAPVDIEILATTGTAITFDQEEGLGSLRVEGQPQVIEVASQQPRLGQRTTRTAASRLCIRTVSNAV